MRRERKSAREQIIKRIIKKETERLDRIVSKRVRSFL